LPLIILIAFKIAIANVLVFIPPPVDTGEAPIHIRNVIIITEGIARADILKLLKPAVRGVTLWKYEVASLAPKSIPCCVLLYSKYKNEKVPKTIKIKEEKITILEFRVIMLTR
jgi:hypothetical protein